MAVKIIMFIRLSAAALKPVTDKYDRKEKATIKHRRQKREREQHNEEERQEMQEE
jgi:hypothetical protein